MFESLHFYQQNNNPNQALTAVSLSLKDYNLNRIGTE